MPIMYKLGCEPVTFHDSNSDQQLRKGWSYEKPEVKKYKMEKKVKLKKVSKSSKPEKVEESGAIAETINKEEL